MTVAIGPMFLLLASILLGAVLLLAAVGITLWISHLRRRPLGASGARIWTHEPSDIAGRDDASIAAPGD